MFAFFLKGSHNALEKAFKTYGSSFFNCLVKALHQQCLIDLLYGYTIASNTDTLVRKKIVSEINKLMLPYIKG